MTPEQIDNLINYLINTGELLATEGYNLALRQVLINGWVWVGIGCAFFLATIGCLSYAAKMDKVATKIASQNRHQFAIERWHEKESEGYVSALFAFIFSVVGIGIGISRLLNPGWYAIQKLMNLF